MDATLDLSHFLWLPQTFEAQSSGHLNACAASSGWVVPDIALCLTFKELERSQEAQ
jgi:hypothetical protein